MRLALSVAALAFLAVPSFAQQPRGAAPARPAAPSQSARPPAPPQQPPAPPPGFFPCRTEAEICYIGVVSGPSQIAILFTNNQQADNVGGPVELSSGEQPGQPLDLGQSVGRVVMLTGVFDPKTGMTRAEVVDTASPLLSFMLKAQFTGDEPAQPAPPKAGKPPAGKR